MIDWSLVIATITGPVLAVQAQKVIERARERRQKQLHLFSTLMATRAIRLSMEHVQALNSINITFYGNVFLGFRWQSKADKDVEKAWQDYLDQLNQSYEPEDFKVWFARGDDLFTELLYKMAGSLGFSFDKVLLRRGGYQPKGHNENENAAIAIRDSLVKILSGQAPLKMDVTSLPLTSEDVERQTALQSALLKQMSGENPLKVEIINQTK